MTPLSHEHSDAKETLHSFKTMLSGSISCPSIDIEPNLSNVNSCMTEEWTGEIYSNPIVEEIEVPMPVKGTHYPYSLRGQYGTCTLSSV